jgi:uncharacterized protein (TIGR02172 family)
MQIATHRTDDRLTLAVAGRLDGTTGTGFAEALDGAMQDEGVRVLVLDLDACAYVSSAGLREVLRAQKRLSVRQGRVEVTNVSREVQHIFELTGLSNMLHIRPKVREISIDGLDLMSAGVCGECYRLDDDTIVKLYHEGVAPEIAAQEKAFAKAAFVLGVPTAISYDVVSCGTRTGIVYEMLDAQLFSAVIRAAPDQIDRHAATLARVAQSIHATPADRAVFPDLKARFRGYIDQMDFFLSAEDIAMLHERLGSIPEADSCVHFDIHTSNIMIRDGEPVIIDMGDFSRGSYLFDVGLLCTIYGVPELGLSELATKIPNDLGLVLWERFVAHYFADKTPEEYAYFNRNRAFLASLRLIYTVTFLPKMRDACVQMIRDTLMPRIRQEHAASDVGADLA